MCFKKITCGEVYDFQFSTEVTQIQDDLVLWCSSYDMYNSYLLMLTIGICKFISSFAVWWVFLFFVLLYQTFLLLYV